MIDLETARQLYLTTAYFGWLHLIVLRACLVTSLVLMFWEGIRERRRLSLEQRHPLLLLSVAGVTGIAFVLRWCFAEWGFLHENFHGYHYMEVLLGSHFEFIGISTPLYGWLYNAVHDWLFLVFPIWPETLFGWNAVLGSMLAGMTVLVTWEFLRSCDGDGPSRLAGAVLAGLCIAVSPAFIRVSVSEVYAPMLMLLYSLVFYALFRYRRSGGIGWLVSFALLSGCIANGRIVPSVWPFFALLGLFLVSPTHLRRRDWQLWLALGFVVAFQAIPQFGPVLLFVAQHHESNTAERFWRFLFTSQNQPFHRTLTPVIFLVLTWLGTIRSISVPKWRWTTAWILVCFLSFWFVYYINQSSAPTNLRNQTIAMWFSAPFVGAAIFWLPKAYRLQSQKWLLIGAIALPLATLPFYTRPWRTVTNKGVEWRFLRETLPTLPEDAVLAHAKRREGQRFNPVRVWAYLPGPDNYHRTMSLDTLLDANLTLPENLFVFRGLSMNIHELHLPPLERDTPPDSDDRPDPSLGIYGPKYNRIVPSYTSPRWLPVEETFILEPIRELTFDNVPDDYNEYPGREITIGMYRVVGRKPDVAQEAVE